MSCEEIFIYYTVREMPAIRNDNSHAGTRRMKISGSLIYSDFSRNLSPSDSTVISMQVKSATVSGRNLQMIKIII